MSHFSWFNTQFALGISASWHGDISYRSRRLEIAPGQVLCVSPGEVHSVSRVRKAGAVTVLFIEPVEFNRHAAEHGVPARRADWTVASSSISAALAARLEHLFHVLRPGTTLMELQTCVVELFAVMAPELIHGSRSAPATYRGSDRAVKRMRERLHSEDGWNLDMETLARESGMSRFEALRAFKRRYGLPPHKYQLCVRIGVAREMLRAGHPLSAVAARCQFADQSHFGRHFKRLVGATPAAYARALGLGPPRSRTARADVPCARR